MVIYHFPQSDAIDESAIERMVANSTAQQAAAVAGMKTLSRKREQAVSYAMLAYALEHDAALIASGETHVLPFPSEALYYQPERAPLWQNGEHGKPYLTNHEGVHFNISHCREAIVTAVSSHDVGVDVEGRRKFSDNLLGRAFSEAEQHLVRQSDDPEWEFARIWTRKEAWFKWTGTGILIDHLKTVEEEAAIAQCHIETTLVSPPLPFQDHVFYLSIAQDQTTVL